MKVFASIVILAVIVCGAQGQAMLGNCTLPQYVLKIQPCQTTFIHDLQKNPKSNCSAELQSLTKCTGNTFKTCFAHLGLPDAILNTILQQTFTKDIMCNKAGLQFPSSAGPNNTLPCNTTVAQYTSNINGCSNRLLTMWQTNKADPRTCMEYKMTKVCISKVIQDAQCTVSGLFEEMLRLTLGKNNPFCSNGVDPSSEPTRLPTQTSHTPTSLGAHRVAPTSVSSQSSLSITLFTSVAVVIIFLLRVV